MMYITDLTKYVDENLSGNLSIEHLSAKSGCSTATLKNKCIQTFGETIGEHIHKRKMYAAARLLTSGKYWKVATIGKEIGYTNMSHFAARFYKFFGHYPHTVHIKPDDK